MSEFPVIHTNLWDAVLAVPVTLIVAQIIKIVFSVRRAYVPAIATIIGLAISVFYSHRHDIWAGLFMGFFYGSAAIGSYASITNSVKAYRSSPKTRKK
jgi:cell shape-determining protein MreD